MSKVDFKKDLKDLYNPSSNEVVFVDVPQMDFLMIDGSGNPNTSQEYQKAIEALYAVSYALKFIIKKGKQAIDYSVMPLEGLWWVDNGANFSTDNKDIWKWTSMIMQPKYVTEALFKDAVEQVKKKKNLPTLPKLRFQALLEGPSVQIMHIGPYASEESTIQKIRAHMMAQGYEVNGKHHEIYLSDPRKLAPEKLKTIIRQPVKKKQS
jgi:hypothetical protein